MSTTQRSLARVRTRWSAVGAAVAITLGAGGIGLVQASTPASVDVTVTISPERILDTRTDLGLAGPFEPNAPRDVQVTGAVDVATDSGTATKTVVPEGASAVLVNVTVTEPTDVGFLTLRPAGATGLPATSTVNFGAGATEPNAATVALSGDGELQVWVFMPTASATAEVLIDVVGYTTNHDHDDRYYTEDETDTKLAAKADGADVYTKSQVDAAVDAKADSADVYTKSQVDAAVDAKADSADVYTQSEVDDAVAAAGGLDYAAGSNVSDLPTTMTTAATMTISVPTAGFIAVTGSTRVGIPGGDSATCQLRLDATPKVSAALTDGFSTYANTFGEAVSAGDHTIDLQCSGSTATGISLFAPWLTAVFSANRL